MSRSNRKIPPRENQKQAGFSLFVVLIFMTVIMMLGITAMQAAGLQERMASHGRDRAIALQAAEGALRAGELHSRNLASFDGTDECTDAFCTSSGSPDLYSYEWNDSKSSEIPLTKQSTNLASAPRYFVSVAGIVRRSGSPDGPGYRVSARSTGNNSATTITLQSVYVP